MDRWERAGEEKDQKGKGRERKEKDEREVR